MQPNILNEFLRPYKNMQHASSAMNVSSVINIALILIAFFLAQIHAITMLQLLWFNLAVNSASVIFIVITYKFRKGLRVLRTRQESNHEFLIYVIYFQLHEYNNPLNVDEFWKKIKSDQTFAKNMLDMINARIVQINETAAAGLP